MSSSLDLLLAGLSAGPQFDNHLRNIGGNALRFHQSTLAVGRVGNQHLFRADNNTHFHNDAESEASLPCRRHFNIYIKTLAGNITPLEVESSTTIKDVKTKMEAQEGIPTDQQRLIFEKRMLDDYLMLEECGINEDSVVYIVICLKGGTTVIAVNPETLDPEHNCNLTDVKDDGKTFIRGGEVYRRPYGWMRFALRVKGQFENDAWLGDGASGRGSSSGEWPVCYHGTSKHNAESIAEKGYDLSKGKRFAYGRGIYTTPDLKIAEKYAQQFLHQGKTYLMVMQNRLNPNTLRKVQVSFAGGGEYWISPYDEDVRAYGILIREKK